MEDFYTENQPEPKKNTKLYVTLCLLVLGLGIGAGYYFFGNDAKTSSPPSLDVGSDTYKGFIGSGNFLKFDDSDIARTANMTGEIMRPAGATYYYSEENMTMRDVIFSIKPALDNQCLIALYRAEENSFYTYPAGPYQGTIVIQNSQLDSFEIPAGEAFAIICKNGYGTWGIKAGNQQPQNLNYNLNDLEAGWHLKAFTSSNQLNQELESCENRINSIWVMSDPNQGEGDFEARDPASPALNAGFYIAWLELTGETNSCSASGQPQSPSLEVSCSVETSESGKLVTATAISDNESQNTDEWRYFWSFEEANDFEEGEKVQTHQYPNAGVHSINLKVVDENFSQGETRCSAETYEREEVDEPKTQPNAGKTYNYNCDVQQLSPDGQRYCEQQASPNKSVNEVLDDMSKSLIKDALEKIDVIEDEPKPTKDEPKPIGDGVKKIEFNVDQKALEEAAAEIENGKNATPSDNKANTSGNLLKGVELLPKNDEVNYNYDFGFNNGASSNTMEIPDSCRPGTEIVRGGKCYYYCTEDEVFELLDYSADSCETPSSTFFGK